MFLSKLWVVTVVVVVVLAVFNVEEKNKFRFFIVVFLVRRRSYCAPLLDCLLAEVISSPLFFIFLSLSLI